MKKVIFLILLFASQISFAQIHAYNNSYGFIYDNSVNLEILGHGKYYSVNYERLITDGYNYKSFYQAGVSYFDLSTANAELRIPIMATQLISFDMHHIEFGIGQVGILEFDNSTLSKFSLFSTFKIGYRYQHPDNRLICKVLFTPTVDSWSVFNFYSPYSSSSNFLGITPWGAVSIGYAF